MENYVLENGLYCYGPRFWSKKTTGEIVSSSPQITAAWPYWDDFGDFEWPGLEAKGLDEADLDVLSLPYVPNWQMPGIPKTVKDGKVAYDPFPDPSPLPDPEETQIRKIQQQIEMLTAQAAALADGQEMQEDVITEIVMHVYE